MRRRILYDIEIAGRNISSLLNPVLQQINVHDGSDNEADTASIVIDDSYGQTILANARDPITIRLGLEGEGVREVFRGFIDEPRFKFDRSTGRTLSIEAKSVDLEGKAKEPVEKYWDDESLQTILNDAMGLAGIPIQVADEFASITRDYEAMDGEDPLSFVARIAREVGATFKVMGDRAVFAARNTGNGVDGQALEAFRVAYGQNLIRCDISPIIPRAKFSAFKHRWFDFAAGKFIEEVTEAVGKSDLVKNAPYATQGLAKETSSGEKTEAERKGGEGTIVAMGSSIPQADGKCLLSGARPGVDGSYIISSVDHSATRGAGYTVTLEVKRPDDGAGTDNR